MRRNLCAIPPSFIATAAKCRRRLLTAWVIAMAPLFQAAPAIGSALTFDPTPAGDTPAQLEPAAPIVASDWPGLTKISTSDLIDPAHLIYRVTALAAGNTGIDPIDAIDRP
jgi:hypothetical protein